MEGFLRYLFGGLMEGLMHGGRYFRNFTVLFIIIIVIYIYIYIYIYMLIKEMWFFLAKGKSGKFASDQEKA